MKKFIEELKLDTVETEESKIFFKMVDHFLENEENYIDDIEKIKVGFEKIDFYIYLDNIKKERDDVLQLGNIELKFGRFDDKKCKYKIELSKYDKGIRYIGIIETELDKLIRSYWFKLDGSPISIIN